MSDKTWHQKHRDTLTLAGRIADTVAAFVGSWAFIWIHVVWFSLWILLPVEAFPFGLLTMIVSLEAILLATLIMMSQNRQADRDRHQAEADFETNVAAKREIEEVQRRLARIENDKLDKILELLTQKK